MIRVARWLRIVLAAATVALMAAMAWQCINIYIEGAANAAGGLHDGPYTRDIVAERLRPFLLPGILYGALAVITGIVSISTEKLPADKRQRMVKPDKQAEMSPVRLKAVRRAVFLLAAALIITGILNGGMRDVLIKAINICTECIGLG